MLVAENKNPDREKLNNFFLIFKEFFNSFQKNNNFEAAATLSFYSFFALIPLLLMAVYPIGSFLVSSQSAIEGLEYLFPKLFPEINRILVKEVQAIARHKALWETLNFVTLLWLIIPFSKACRTQFSMIFKFERDLSYFRAKLRDSLGSLIILVLFLLLVLSEVLYSLSVRTFLIDLPLVLEVSYLLVPFIIALTVVFFFFLFFIPLKVKWIHVLVGSLITVSLWTLIRPAFSLFLRINPQYGFAFGSLKTVFLLVLWAYYSFLAILAGAEILANLNRKEVLFLKGLFFNHRAGRKIPPRFIRDYKSGDIIFKEGETGQDMYYILSGGVTVSKGGKIIRVMKENDYFGEIAMLLNSPRTATITVVEPNTRLIEISRDNFETILRENPSIVLAILKDMSYRLKSTNEDVFLRVPPGGAWRLIRPKEKNDRGQGQTVPGERF
jgi:membrane protein